MNTEVVIEDKTVLFSFRGRIRRATFWDGGAACLLYCLGETVLLLALTILLEVKTPQLWIIGAVLAGPPLWIWLAVCAKRWHDLGLPGIMALLNVVLPALPLVMVKTNPVPVAIASGAVAAILILCLGLVRGTSGSNKFGESSI